MEFMLIPVFYQNMFKFRKILANGEPKRNSGRTKDLKYKQNDRIKKPSQLHLKEKKN